MTDTTLKSCFSCEHCHEVDDLFFECKKYTFTVDDYLWGTSTKKNHWCITAREDSKMCGPEAVGHEPRTSEPEMDVYEPLVIDMLKTVWAFIRTFLPTTK